MVTEDLSALDRRAGWTVEDRLATFQLEPGGWRAEVRPVREPGRAYDRWHVAVIDAAGRAQHTKKASTLNEAARLAEAHVKARSS